MRITTEVLAQYAENRRVIEKLQEWNKKVEEAVGEIETKLEEFIEKHKEEGSAE